MTRPDDVPFRTALFTHDLFASDAHANRSHLEHPDRIRAIHQMLIERGSTHPRPPFAPASDEAFFHIHAPAYIDALTRFCASGGGWIDPDTYATPDSLTIARLAVGAGIAAVDHVLDPTTEHPRAVVLARPPGHHATPDRAMGFCLVNTTAIAAAHAIRQRLSRVAIVDWDVHHGNGTQDAFYGRSDVLSVSLHQHPFYPGTGFADDIGIGAGAGATLNLPLHAGADDSTYMQLIDELVVPKLAEFAPDLIIVAAGYDAHERDPLGGMRLTEDGFTAMTARLVTAADAHCAGRIVAILEGGYAPDALATSVWATIRQLDVTPVR